jgi:hypothetical protein
VPEEGMEQRAKTSLPAVTGNLTANVRHEDLPEIIARAGFVWDEFFRAQIRNPQTRKAYGQAVRQYLEWQMGWGRRKRESRKSRVDRVAAVLAF